MDHDKQDNRTNIGRLKMTNKHYVIIEVPMGDTDKDGELGSLIYKFLDAGLMLGEFHVSDKYGKTEQ